MGTVYTSRIGYRGDAGLDITVKSAKGIGEILAPTWALVGGYKHWQGYTALTNEQYTNLYLDLLRSRYRTNEQAFIQLIQRPQLVLLCYCRSGVFCHRHLALDVLEKIANAKGLPFTRGGELSITNSR
jgi:hypothetical protein